MTDANVVLGRINADRPIGGRAGLDVEAARRAIENHVASPLGLGIEEAAEAIVAVAETAMAGALRLVSIERGHDPGKFWMVPFGGAGALHTCSFVRSLSLAGALVPRFPGVISALGCVLADMRYDSVQTLQGELATLDLGRLRTVARSSLASMRGLLTDSQVSFEAVDETVELDMSYQGQTHSVAVPLAAGSVDEIDIALITAGFEAAYSAAFGRLLDGVEVRVLGVRTSVVGRRPRFDLAQLARLGAEGETSRGTRELFFGGRRHTVTVWNRLALATGEIVTGPCVLEQPDATIFVEPGFRGEVDELGNLVLTVDAGAHR